jgi:NADH-quinone oxidoreductase subunit G
VGVLALPSSTTEELHLLARIARGLGVANLDHRLRQRDFRDQGADPLFAGLGLPIADIERLDSLLVIGADLRQEAPVLAHRVRKAAVRNKARVAFVNPAPFEYLFPVAAYRAVPALGMVEELAAIGRAVAEVAGQPLPPALAGAATPAAAQRAVAEALLGGEKRLVLLGGLAERHPAYADLRAVAASIAALAGATLGYLPGGGNCAGAALAGVLPHRLAGGRAADRTGLNAGAMLTQGLDAYMLFGGIEPALDTGYAEAQQTLAKAGFVLALTPYAPEAVRRLAHVLLPIGTFAETSGTFVNVEGRWQTFAAAARLVGEARPGWKVLRVLGNLLNLPGFDYESSDAVRAELVAALGARHGQAAETAYQGHWRVQGPLPGALTEAPIYQTDPVVRRAPALQQTRAAARPRAAY